MKLSRNRRRAAYTSAFKVIEQLEGRRLLSTTLVTNTSDSGAGSLRDAITNAQPGDTVDLSAVSGTITLASTINLTQAVTITGPGADHLTIDGNNANLIFNVTGGSVSISGVTLSHGSYSSGGAIFDGGTLSLDHVVFSHNNSTAQGGALTCNGSVTATDCVFDSNAVISPSFAEGGAVYVNSGTATFANCTFSNNSATGGDPDSFEGGEAFGGAVGLRTSTDSFTNCTFSNNTALGIESTMMPGMAESFGGALNFNDSTATLLNCTITGCSAEFGGGIMFYSSTGTNTLTNTIVAGNTSTSGQSPDVASSNLVTDGGHNLIGADFGGGFVNGTRGDIVGSPSSPIDAKLGALADNGGMTQTIALLSGSPAINAGDDAKAPATDQRGFDRVGVSDIGAFEFGATANQAPAFVDGPTSERIVTGNAFTWTVSATDADSDDLSFSAVDELPSWVTLTDNHDGSATLSGTPANADAGSHDLSLRVNDGTVNTDKTFTLNVVLPRWQVSETGILTVTGTDDADHIHVWARGDEIRVDRNDEIEDYLFASVKQIEIRGLDGDDLIIVNTRDVPAYVLGNGGDDTLVGAAENDNLIGGGGSDLLDGGAGDDRLDAFNGNDKLVGGDGEDRLYGRGGDAILCGGAGADRIHAGAGTNTIFADDSTADQIWPGIHDVVNKDDLDLIFALT